MIDTVKSWITRHINRDSLELGIKISVGIVISILLAEFIGMDFAPSTGVVALLSIQATKRESVKTAVRRIISFGYTLGICYLVHDEIGANTAAFTLAVLGIVLLSVLLGWADTLSVNIVIAVHLFMMHQPFTQHLVINETERVIIGMTVAFLVNWYTPNREAAYQKRFSSLESEMSQLLILYGSFLRGQQAMDTGEAMLKSIKKKIEDGMRDAQNFYNNTLRLHAKYYVNYMGMREREWVLLSNIKKELDTLQNVPQSGAYLAEYAEEMAKTIAVERPLEEWGKNYETVYEKMNAIPLPSDRVEFQEQTALFSVLNDFNEIVQIKRNFIAGLTETQKKRYWRKMNQ
ncbi:MAG: aromatic acid exporter family protein [Lachnospiraceae bacterium]|nr:aromatic acid exporter family protein [Lachnospiraceae bacterium]MDD3616074.1 aromatic acid exporter family protein [Lachnospiraceae bacterium]